MTHHKKPLNWYDYTPWGTHYWRNPCAAVGHGHIRNPTEYVKMITSQEELANVLSAGMGGLTIGNPWTMKEPKPMSQKPQPCPFCFSDKTRSTSIGSEDNDERDWFVECTNCLANGPMADSRHEAVQEWNKALRPTIPCPEPLTCPHCKSNEIAINTVMVPNASSYFFAECTACRMRGPVSYEGKHEAADAWNSLARHWE